MRKIRKIKYRQDRGKSASDGERARADAGGGRKQGVVGEL